MRNSVLSSKHTEGLRNGREAVGQEVYVESLCKMQGSPKEKKDSSREPGNEAALVCRNGWELAFGGEARSGMLSRERGAA